MPRHLLVVDDAAIIREIIKDVATRAGWKVVAEAADGCSAVELYRQYHPDATTLDLVMPGSGGLGALRAIRDFDPEAKVVIVSALEQRTVLKEAFKLGASDFLVKPFDEPTLTSTLERLLPEALTA